MIDVYMVIQPLACDITFGNVLGTYVGSEPAERQDRRRWVGFNTGPR